MASLHGLEIATELALEGACAGPGIRGTVRLDRADGASALDGEAQLTALRLDTAGEPAFALARRAAGPIVWDRARGTYAVDLDRGAIAAAPEGRPQVWGHLVATVVVPLLLVERGELALHASAALVSGGAVLFCGPSGRGKSSAALLASAVGARPLADDAVLITASQGALVTWPGGSRLWVDGPAVAAAAGVRPSELDPAGRASRHPLAVDDPGPGPFPIVAIVVLGEHSDELRTRPLDPADALPELVPSLVHAGAPDALRRSFAALAAALEAIPAWEVALPSRQAAGPESMSEVLKLVA